MNQSAADNDILLKGAWYGLLRELVAAIPSKAADTLVLGQARFVVGKRLQRSKDRGSPDAAAALEHFNDLMGEIVQAEPSSAEISFAAQLEHSAQTAGLALDAGESLLCAIVVHRGLHRLATGDKRAIRALETLSGQRSDLGQIHGKVVCLEQLFLRLLRKCSPLAVRTAVCSRPDVDKALTACFAHAPGQGMTEDWASGLASYIRALRREAPTMLAS